MSWSATLSQLLVVSCVVGVLAVGVGVAVGEGIETPAGGAPAPTDTASAPTIFSVAIVGMAFEPREVEVSPGDIIIWTNRSEYPHTVNADPTNLALGGPNSDTKYPGGILPGDSYSWTVPSDSPPGRQWFYFCRFNGEPGDGTQYGDGLTGSVFVK